MESKLEQLIEILLDKTAREDERDDAAIDLRDYPDLRALNALLKVVSDPYEDDMILDNAAESIGKILIDLNYFKEDLLNEVLPIAKRTIIDFVEYHNPSLLRQKKDHENTS